MYNLLFYYFAKSLIAFQRTAEDVGPYSYQISNCKFVYLRTNTVRPYDGNPKTRFAHFEDPYDGNPKTRFAHFEDPYGYNPINDNLCY